jgi:hypothetical protein
LGSISGAVQWYTFLSASQTGLGASEASKISQQQNCRYLWYQWGLLEASCLLFSQCEKTLSFKLVSSGVDRVVNARYFIYFFRRPCDPQLLCFIHMALQKSAPDILAE